LQKKIFLLGSSGSIGVNTLKVIRNFENKFKIAGLSVNSNSELLLEQAREFHPEYVIVGNKKIADEIKNHLPIKTKLLIGQSGLVEAAKNFDYDIMVSALVGFAGLAPTIEAIKRNKRIALANKETLVVAGEIINKLLDEYKSEIIPVDSEHSAIFQCLSGEENKSVRRIILTASGGPFFNKPENELKNVTVQDALNHPTWSMGNKITIDSATMMNKGLEVIEAKWLFKVSEKKIDVVIHPQSIIHSMVEFDDCSIKAQLSTPDMKIPIQYALTYPERLNSNFVETDLIKIGQLTFFNPNFNKFRCLKLAFEVIEAGGISPCILNAANEIAVDRFLKNEIGFLQIPEIIEKALSEFENITSPDLEDIFECDRLVRIFAAKIN